MRQATIQTVYTLGLISVHFRLKSLAIHLAHPEDYIDYADLGASAMLLVKARSDSVISSRLWLSQSSFIYFFLSIYPEKLLLQNTESLSRN